MWHEAPVKPVRHAGRSRKLPKLLHPRPVDIMTHTTSSAVQAPGARRYSALTGGARLHMCGLCGVGLIRNRRWLSHNRCGRRAGVSVSNHDIVGKVRGETSTLLRGSMAADTVK